MNLRRFMLPECSSIWIIAGLWMRWLDAFVVVLLQSCRSLRSQRVCSVACDPASYSASQVDLATVRCLVLCYAIGLPHMV